MKTLLDIADWILEKLLITACLICLFIGVYGLYDSYHIYTATTDGSLLYYKPGYEAGGEPEKDIQGRMVAWISIEGTNIDYPVMQGKDNFEYLDKDPYGEFSLSGSIFLDARNSPDLSDSYSLIYGHHMEGGLMFGTLDDYLDEEFFKEHQDVDLIIGDEVNHFKAYAVLETEATERAVFAPTETDISETCQFIQGKSLYYDTRFEPGDSVRILALSTCKCPDTAERTIVFCSYHGKDPIK